MSDFIFNGKLTDEGKDFAFKSAVLAAEGVTKTMGIPPADAARMVAQAAINAAALLDPQEESK